MPSSKARARLPPTVKAYTPRKFEAGSSEMLEYLEKYGYAVVKGAADAQAIDCGHDDFWEFHESIEPELDFGVVRRDDPSTWGRDFLPHPTTGIITGYGFGQSRFCWNLRNLAAVRKTFEAIWGTQDLVTSYDGGNAFRPWHSSVLGEDWRTEGGWWHCDQNATRPNRSGRVCVQGLVTLTPCSEWTGGFCVIPGSHLHHEAYSHRHPHCSIQGDFLPVPDGDPILDGVDAYMLRADAGDLILWDSRTIHCNGPALLPPSSAPAEAAVPGPDQLLRLVGYVCCVPAAWCTADVLRERARAALELTTSTHWPQSFVPTGYAAPWMKPRSPSDYSAEETRLILGDRGMFGARIGDPVQLRKPSSVSSSSARSGRSSSQSLISPQLSTRTSSSVSSSSSGSNRLTKPLTMKAGFGSSKAPEKGTIGGITGSAALGARKGAPASDRRPKPTSLPLKAAAATSSARATKRGTASGSSRLSETGSSNRGSRGLLGRLLGSPRASTPQAPGGATRVPGRSSAVAPGPAAPAATQPLSESNRVR